MSPLDRKKYIRLRQELSTRDRNQKEKAIAQAVLPFLKGKVGIYSPIQGEVDILRFVQDFDLYFPCTLDDTTLAFYPKSDTMHMGAFSVMEPSRTIAQNHLDVIVVPMVCFYQTNRVGYGKGYYDRYLKDTDALTIGIAFDCQENKDLVIKEPDVPLDFVITETRCIRRQ